MKKVKIEWTETDLVLYGYEEEFEVSDDFEANKDNCLKIVRKLREEDNKWFDSKWTEYQDGDRKLYPLKVDKFCEILPPSPEEKRAEYMKLLEEMEQKIATMEAEKERILKLVNE